jgi:hypothetical protein
MRWVLSTCTNALVTSRCTSPCSTTQKGERQTWAGEGLGLGGLRAGSWACCAGKGHGRGDRCAAGWLLHLLLTKFAGSRRRDRSFLAGGVGLEPTARQPPPYT